MYQVKKFMFFSDIAIFLNENPLCECIQIINVKDGIHPYRMLYRINKE